MALSGFVFELFAKLGLNTDEYEKSMNDSKAKGESFASKLGSGLKTAAKVGAAALTTASAAVTAFAGKALQTGQSFDASMSQVAATMGYTIDELNTEGSEAAQTLATLSDFAQQMGSTTAFSASEAADALNYMALAGYDAETSMAMLPNVLNLAAAGGIGLAEASDMVTDASSALGLSLDETSELVDKMATASSKSNTSVAQLGEAILTVGGTAKVLSSGTTELSTALGILADNGIKGAEGGTALRNIILSLSAPTDQAAEKMKELGIEVYDSEGNMRHLADIFDQFNWVLQDMTQGEQTDVLNTIFNKVDLKSANALLATSIDRWEELEDAINDSAGSAQAMAEVQLDNLAGDITILKSSFEGLQIAVSDTLSGSAREFVQFGSKALSAITEGFKEGGIDGAMEAVGEMLSEGLGLVVEKLPDLVSIAAKLIGAFGQAILDNSDLLIQTAFDIVLELARGLTEGDSITAMVDGIVELLSNIALWIGEYASVLATAAVDIILALVTALTDPENIGQLVDMAIFLMLSIGEALIKAIPELIKAAPEIIANLVTAIVENVPKLLDAAWEMIKMLVQGITDHFPEILAKGKEIVLKVAAGILEFQEKMREKAKEILEKFIAGIKEKFTELKNKGKEIVDKVKEGLMQVIENAKNWGRDLIQNFIGGLSEKWNNLKSTVSDIAGGIKSFLGFSEPEQGPLKDFHTYAPDMMELFAKGIRDNKSKVLDELGSFTASVSTGFTSTQIKNGSSDGQPIQITVQSVLDGKVISETVTKYQRGKAVAMGV